MGKILEALAEENLCINEPYTPRTENYQKASARVEALLQELRPKLDRDGGAVLNQLVDAVVCEGLVLNEAQFIHGFRLGARIMMEIMEDTDSLLQNKQEQKI